jgi:hypothetical protein
MHAGTLNLLFASEPDQVLHPCIKIEPKGVAAVKGPNNAEKLPLKPSKKMKIESHALIHIVQPCKEANLITGNAIAE